MKILFDAHLSENKITGIGRYINELLLELLKIDTKNEYIVLVHKKINSEHPLRKINSKNYIMVPVNFRGLSLKEHYEIKKFSKQFKPDIYHHPHFDLPFRINIPSVITIHDLKYILFPEFFPKMSFLKRRLIMELTANSIRNAGTIISVSESTKNDIVKIFNKYDKNIITIHHGYKNFEGITSSRNSFSDHEIDKYKPYLFFVGERRPHKNIINLIKALILLHNRKNKIKLIIVGKKYKNYTQPEKFIREMKLEGQVHLFDYVDDIFLKTLYLNAEMFIFPSLYEGFGFPILEAMSAGLPVIGSNISSIPEVVGDAGLLVDTTKPEYLASKIEAVLKDDKLSKELGKKSLRRSLDFSWKRCAIETLSVYEELFKEIKKAKTFYGSKNKNFTYFNSINSGRGR
jgi:glycosyltransferase involved in cell wall biosynthesis